MCGAGGILDAWGFRWCGGLDCGVAGKGLGAGAGGILNAGLGLDLLLVLKEFFVDGVLVAGDGGGLLFLELKNLLVAGPLCGCGGRADRRCGGLLRGRGGAATVGTLCWCGLRCDWG